MRLLVTDVPCERLEGHWDAIQKRLRALFFEGQRISPCRPGNGRRCFAAGCLGLPRPSRTTPGTGIYKYYDARGLAETTFSACTTRVGSDDAALRLRQADSKFGEHRRPRPEIGSVGGGNHFVELQRVDGDPSPSPARSHGHLAGHLAIMVHSGSVAPRARGGRPLHGPGEGAVPEAVPPIRRTTSTCSPWPDRAEPAPLSREHAERRQLRLRQPPVPRADGGARGRGVPRHHRVLAASLRRTSQPRLRPWGPDVLHRKGATPAEGPATDSDWIGRPSSSQGPWGALYLDGPWERRCAGAPVMALAG